MLAFRQKEREAHAAADDERLALVDERVDDLDLIGDLRAAEDGDEGTLRVLEHARERGHLALHEVARVRRKQRRDASCRGMRAMRRAERVVDVGVAELGELLAKRRVVLLLALVEAQVLEQKHIPLAKRRRLRLRVLAHRVACERDRLAEELRQTQGSWAQRELLLEALARRTTEVAHEDDARSVADKLLDGRQCRLDARVVGHDAVGHGNVEIDAHEHALAARVEIVDRLD